MRVGESMGSYLKADDVSSQNGFSLIEILIAILAGGAQIFIGVEGGIVSLPTIATQDMYSYYWTQVF